MKQFPAHYPRNHEADPADVEMRARVRERKSRPVIVRRATATALRLVQPRTRPPYPEEFRREAVRLAQLGDKPQRELARDLGISDVTLRNWLKEEKGSRGERPGRFSSDEREELARLRDENATLRMEREILRKAAVFFAREDDGR